MVVEAVCCSVRDAQLAQDAGADRIELCSALEVGGLTPSAAMVRAVRGAVKLPMMAMVRPRAGDFTYDGTEWQVILDDAAILLEEGADGIVFGALTTSLMVEPRSAEIAAMAAGRCTFHRAIDATEDPIAAAQVVAQMGFARILTSGGKRTALEGAAVMKAMSEHLTILACGKVRAANAPAIAEASGAREVHLGPRKEKGTPFLQAIAEFGVETELDDGELRRVVSALASR